MKRAVFDTNVLLSALLATSGVSAHLLIHSEHFTLITSEAILAELAEKSHLPRIQVKYYLTDAVITEYITRLRAAATVVDVHSSVTVVRDPDDNMVLACALDGGAGYVVSRDRDLLDIGTYQGIQLLSPEQFLAIVREELPE